MDFFTFVVIVVAIGCATGVIIVKQKNRSQRSAQPEDAVEQELNELRERVEVLERILTDEKFHLHAELEKLERGS